MKKLTTIIIALIALLLMGQAATVELTGKVERVIDGDTVVLLDSANIRHNVRLDGIDAPETSQLKGKEATEGLQALVLQKSVRITSTGNDKYGRVIGRIYLNDRWINLEMVKKGLAWHYKQYSNDEDLAKAEVSAQEKKIGIWADPNPIPPWKYRSGTKQAEVKVGVVVYVTRAGTKYHRASCVFVQRRPIAVDLAYARTHYKPCDMCKPPK